MKALQFLKQTRQELTHVVWPTRTRAIIYTIIIIVFSLGIGYMLGGFDAFFRTVLRTFIIN